MRITVQAPHSSFAGGVRDNGGHAGSLSSYLVPNLIEKGMGTCTGLRRTISRRYAVDERRAGARRGALHRQCRIRDLEGWTGACAHETTAEVHGAIEPPSNRRRITPSIRTRIVQSQTIEILVLV